MLTMSSPMVAFPGVPEYMPPAQYAPAAEGLSELPIQMFPHPATRFFSHLQRSVSECRAFGPPSCRQSNGTGSRPAPDLPPMTDSQR